MLSRKTNTPPAAQGEARGCRVVNGHSSAACRGVTGPAVDARRAWVVEARHQVAALGRGRGAVHAQVRPAAPVQVVGQHVERAGHGAEQQHLGEGGGVREGLHTGGKHSPWRRHVCREAVMRSSGNAAQPATDAAGARTLWPPARSLASARSSSSSLLHSRTSGGSGCIGSAVSAPSGCRRLHGGGRRGGQLLCSTARHGSASHRHRTALLAAYAAPCLPPPAQRASCARLISGWLQTLRHSIRTLFTPRRLPPRPPPPPCVSRCMSAKRACW